MNPYHILTFISIVTAVSCNDKSISEADASFNITNHYIAGTITPPSNTYTSVYFIKLLEGNQAVFIGGGKDFAADYTITRDSLLVIVSDPNNYREARFAIDKNHKIISANYKALTMPYKATGTLLPIESKNQFAGKTFKGEEFKMGPSSYRPILHYKFTPDGTHYGTGEDVSAIDATNKVEIINNSAFKYKDGSTTEMGFINGDTLTTFRSQGLLYFGKYHQQ